MEDDEIIENEYNKKNRTSKTIFTLAYPSDIEQAYAFYCARYKDITYDEFLNLGYNDFKKKLFSIPETEPLYKIIKSRTININKIKDKNERDYWRELKKINEIPGIYLLEEETDIDLKLGGIINGNKLN